ncbi:hypothetical protein GCM10008938_46620 [Deinococcus roseus]|uniref:Uncharacterized protein n=1 Tax=Deinococcus roseus TaxID=392414 RepID=A0ABQ2DEL8_9DEIO|nr:hypothetical protein GCM10008938_46620 [Deinococcus roseus]
MLTGDKDDSLYGVVVDLAESDRSRDGVTLTQGFCHLDECVWIDFAVPQRGTFALTELATTGFASEETQLVLAVGFAEGQVVSSRLEVVLALRVWTR